MRRSGGGREPDGRDRIRSGCGAGAGAERRTRQRCRSGTSRSRTSGRTGLLLPGRASSRATTTETRPGRSSRTATRRAETDGRVLDGRTQRPWIGPRPTLEPGAIRSASSRTSSSTSFSSTGGGKKHGDETGANADNCLIVAPCPSDIQGQVGVAPPSNERRGRPRSAALFILGSALLGRGWAGPLRELQCRGAHRGLRLAVTLMLSTHGSRQRSTETKRLNVALAGGANAASCAALSRRPVLCDADPFM